MTGVCCRCLPTSKHSSFFTPIIIQFLKKTPTHSPLTCIKTPSYKRMSGYIQSRQKLFQYNSLIIFYRLKIGGNKMKEGRITTSWQKCAYFSVQSWLTIQHSMASLVKFVSKKIDFKNQINDKNRFMFQRKIILGPRIFFILTSLNKSMCSILTCHTTNNLFWKSPHSLSLKYKVHNII